MVFLIHFSIVSSLNFASLLLTAECNLTNFSAGFQVTLTFRQYTVPPALPYSHISTFKMSRVKSTDDRPIYISGKIFSSKTHDITGCIKGFSSQSGISSVEKQENQHSLLARSNLELRHTFVFLLDSKLHKEKRFTKKCNYEP